MMNLNGMIYVLPNELKLLIATFIVVLSIGFYSGLTFVNESSSMSPEGIEQQYLGNESDPNAEVMKFRKSEREMLALIHNHIISMSVIFFLVGLIFSLTRFSKRLKILLMIEPLLSVILTFGGLYFLWKGITWMTYLVFLSGSLMTLSYTFMVIIIFKQLMFCKTDLNKGEF